MGMDVYLTLVSTSFLTYLDESLCTISDSCMMCANLFGFFEN